MTPKKTAHIDTSDTDDEYPTPTKVTRLSLAPMESPSDRLTIRQQKKRVPQNMSMKFETTNQDLEQDDSQNSVYVSKVYLSKDSYNIDRVDKKDVAEIFACKICERFPKVGLVSIHCFHVFCNDCIQNFKTNVKTSKCPAVNCEKNFY